MNDLLYFIFILLVVIIFLSPFWLIILYIIWSKNFKKNSVVYNSIIDLNNRGIIYKDVRKTIRFYDSMNSLRSLRKIDPEQRIYLAIKSNEQLLNTELKKILMNRKNYFQYLELFNNILSDLYYDKSKYKIVNGFITRIQYMICKRKLIKPRTNLKVFYNANYISPKGRNEYNVYKNFNYDDLVCIASYYENEINKERLRQNMMAIERAKMSDNLRYNVLKRDNFRCQICGSTQSDGVKLHVDHIIPVSKGGKTQMSNLQTLCERCNIGKSNKV